MTDMIKPVARAIYEGRNGKGCTAWAHLPKSYQEPYLKDAIAAIKAMHEPTDEMVMAGMSALSDNGVDEANLDDAKLCHEAMIDAALGENK